MTITLSTRLVAKCMALLVAGFVGLHAYRDHQATHVLGRWAGGADAMLGRVLATPEVKAALLKAYPDDKFVAARIAAAEKVRAAGGAK